MKSEHYMQLFLMVSSALLVKGIIYLHKTYGDQSHKERRTL